MGHFFGHLGVIRLTSFRPKTPSPPQCHYGFARGGVARHLADNIIAHTDGGLGAAGITNAEVKELCGFLVAKYAVADIGSRRYICVRRVSSSPQGRE